jgi:hypothetical protein
MITFPLDAGLFPNLWKQAVDVMLEEVPVIPRSNKLIIIQLLEADINKVLRIAFARNITRLAKDHKSHIGTSVWNSAQHVYDTSD